MKSLVYAIQRLRYPKIIKVLPPGVKLCDVCIYNYARCLDLPPSFQSFAHRETCGVWGTTSFIHLSKVNCMIAGTFGCYVRINENTFIFVGKHGRIGDKRRKLHNKLKNW